MKRAIYLVVFIALFGNLSLAVTGQALAETSDPTRDATRERLRDLLDSSGPTISVAFKPSTKAPYNFSGMLTTGLKNCDSMEIVLSVTENNTIGVRVWPHYKGNYINLNRAKDSVGLMKRLLLLSNNNFLFWGRDDSSDVFSGFTFTLESGFPEEAISIVLRSIDNLDKFVGEMRPAIDGSAPAP